MDLAKKLRSIGARNNRKAPRTKRHDGLKSTTEENADAKQEHPGAGSLKGALNSKKDLALSFAEIRESAAKAARRNESTMRVDADRPSGHPDELMEMIKELSQMRRSSGRARVDKSKE